MTTSSRRQHPKTCHCHSQTPPHTVMANAFVAKEGSNDGQQRGFSTFGHTNHNYQGQDEQCDEYYVTREAAHAMTEICHPSLQTGIETAIDVSRAREIVRNDEEGAKDGKKTVTLRRLLQQQNEEGTMIDVANKSSRILDTNGKENAAQTTAYAETTPRRKSPRVHDEEDDDRTNNKLGPPQRFPSFLPNESTQTLLVSPKEESPNMTLAASPDSSLLVSPHSSKLSPILHDLSGDNDDCTVDDDDDDDRYDEAPVMIALGLPVVHQSTCIPSSISEGTEEALDEIIPRRQKSVDELNEEAINEVLASNVAINHLNAKGGKKVLPEVDESAIIRRQSSRMLHNKSSEYSYCDRSGDKSGDKSSDRSGKSGDKGSGKSGELAIDDCGTFRYSNTPPRPKTPLPAFGTRPNGDLMMDEMDEDSDDLIVHPGLPLILPGAYFMPGPNAQDRQVSDMTDISVFGDEDPFPADEENALSPLAIQEVLSTGIEAELAGDIHAGVIIDGEIVTDDEGMTEDELKAAIRWKKIQVVIVVGILALIGIIVTAVLTIRSSGPSTGEVQGDSWVRFGPGLDGPSGDDNLFFGISFSLSGNGLRFATGLPGIDKSVDDIDVGQVQIFDFVENQWVQTSTLYFDSQQSKAGEALSISANGKRVIVGSPFWSDEVGLISVFERMEKGDWQRIGTDIRGSDSDRSGRFGKTVAISNDGRVIAGGAPFAYYNSSQVGGVVRVFAEIASEWVQMGHDISSKFNNTLFGTSMAMSADGNRIAVGATNTGVEVGSVHVFDFNGSRWIESGQSLNGTIDYESFGSSVALNAAGNLLAVGAIGSPGEDSHFNSGKVQVFKFDSDEWIQLGGDILGTQSETLGTSVDLSDSGILAIGCPSGTAGHIKVYHLDDNNEWKQIKNSIDGDTDGETFGFSVSISADGTIVGSGAPNANFDGGQVKKVGAVHVYQNTDPENATKA